MQTSNHAPMIASVRSGSTGSTSSWDRQGHRAYRGFTKRGNSVIRLSADRERRALKRAERVGFLTEIDLQLVRDEAKAVIEYEAANIEHEAVEAYLLDCAEFDEAELFAEFGVDSYAELYAVVCVDGPTDNGEAEQLAWEAAGWGESFDPDDIQWGFAVRTRP